MKITGSSGISVNISAARELGSLLKNIRPGDSISAVVIRGEGNRAMLEIGGKLIQAEFTSGIPREKNIELVLTSRSQEKIQFSLKDETSAGKISGFLSPFSVLHEDEINKSSLQNLARFINSSRGGLAEINLFLLGIKKEQRRDKEGADFFNRLLRKGVPLQTLIDLSSILYGKYNPVLYMTYRYLMELNGKKNSFAEKQNTSSFEHSIDHLCDILKEDDSDLSFMLDYIFNGGDDSSIYGELAYPDDEGFSGIEYVVNGDSVFLTFDLSAAGELGVFIKTAKDSVFINFLSGKEETLGFFKNNEIILKEMLERNGIKKSVIGYFDSKKIVDKIKIWSLDFYTKSGFNVKV